MTGQAVLTPMLMVIIMITGDFLSMSLATDRVRPSETPNSWEIGKITAAGLILGLCFLAFCTGILAIGIFKMHYGIDTLRTITAIVLVYGSQSITYAVRDRRHFWGLRPTQWLVLSTCADLLFISVLANRGIAMAPFYSGCFSASSRFRSSRILASLSCSVLFRARLSSAKATSPHSPDAGQLT